jgi:hypothetical protein
MEVRKEASMRTSTRKNATIAIESGLVPTHDEIAARAYALYEQRGAADGSDVEDWLAAERELLGGRSERAVPRRGADAGDAIAVRA